MPPRLKWTHDVELPRQVQLRLSVGPGEPSEMLRLHGWARGTFLTLRGGEGGRRRRQSRRWRLLLPQLWGPVLCERAGRPWLNRSTPASRSAAWRRAPDRGAPGGHSSRRRGAGWAGRFTDRAAFEPRLAGDARGVTFYATRSGRASSRASRRRLRAQAGLSARLRRRQRAGTGQAAMAPWRGGGETTRALDGGPPAPTPAKSDATALRP